MPGCCWLKLTGERKKRILFTPLVTRFDYDYRTNEKQTGWNFINRSVGNAILYFCIGPDKT
jgi:hypothetical protein